MSGQHEGYILHANTAALAIGGFVSFALIVWDFVAYLPDEIRLLKDFRKVSWRSPDPYSFLLVRWSGLAFGVASLFTLGLKTEHCKLVASLTQVFSILAVVVAGILSGRRMASLWGNHAAIAAASTVLFVCMISSWIAVASQYRGFRLKGPLDSNGAPIRLPNFGTDCGVAPLVPWHSLSYIGSTIYFGAIFFLALLRWSRQRTERVLNLGLTPLNRACLWYLMVNFITSLAILIVVSNRWSTDLSGRISPPFFILFITGMAQRVYLNSQADYKLRKEHIQEMSTLNLKPKIPRWSWSPQKKQSVASISTGAASLRMMPNANFHGIIHTSHRQPAPPLIPTCTTNSPILTPLPPQHILSVEKAKAVDSASSSLDLKPSGGSSHGHVHTLSQPSSTERLLAHVDRPHKASVNARAVPSSRHHVYGSSSGGSEAGESSMLHFAHQASTSLSGSPAKGSLSQVGSPLSVSTMGFGSPPGSPPVLSLPWPGGKAPSSSRKVMAGSRPIEMTDRRGSEQRRRERKAQRERERERERTQSDTGHQNSISASPRRMASMRSGWVE